MNDWSKIRNEKIRGRIAKLRGEGERPRKIYETLAEEFELSESRIRQIEFGVKS